MSEPLRPRDEGARFIAELNGYNFFASDCIGCHCGVKLKDLKLEEVGDKGLKEDFSRARLVRGLGGISVAVIAGSVSNASRFVMT